MYGKNGVKPYVLHDKCTENKTQNGYTCNLLYFNMLQGMFQYKGILKIIYIIFINNESSNKSVPRRGYGQTPNAK